MKRITAFLLLLFMLFTSTLAFASCGGKTPPAVSDATDGVSADPITEPLTDPATDKATAPVTDPVTEPVVVDPVVGFINPLTGLPTESDLSKQRPVAISIDNVLRAQPTIGLSLADVIFELPAEGFETRMLAVFLDYAKLPTIGNVRSVRDYFVRFAADFDSVLVHAGSDTDSGWLQLGPNALKYGFLISYMIKTGEIKYAIERQDLWTNGIDNIDSANYFPNPMFRDLDRMYNMSPEHSLMVNGEIIVDSIEYKQYRTEIDEGFTYPYAIGSDNSAPSENDAKTIFLPYNPYRSDYGASYTYDAEKGLYLRSNFDSRPSVDGLNDTRLAFKNVIILEVSTTIFPNDSKNRLNVDYVGEGMGYYCANGKYEEITWKREAADKNLVILASDGQLLDIVPGKVIINVYPSEYHDSLKID